MLWALRYFNRLSGNSERPSIPFQCWKCGQFIKDWILFLSKWFLPFVTGQLSTFQGCLVTQRPGWHPSLGRICLAKEHWECQGAVEGATWSTTIIETQSALMTTNGDNEALGHVMRGAWGITGLWGFQDPADKVLSDVVWIQHWPCFEQELALDHLLCSPPTQMTSPAVSVGTILPKEKQIRGHPTL